MKLSISPCLLIIAALVAIAWYFRGPVFRAMYRVRAERLRRRISRKLAAPLICIVGHVDDDAAVRWMKAIRAAPPGSLDVLIHSNGGATQARSRVVRALSAHNGFIVAHVPEFAWSAGAGIAAVCDRIHMNQDAVLGPFDPARPLGQDVTFCAVECLSHETCTPQEVIRSHQALDEGEADLRRALAARRRVLGARIEWNNVDGVVRDDAGVLGEATKDPEDHLVEQLVRGGWGNHWRPIYLEDARELGLDARLEGRVMAEMFSELARLSMLALPEAQR